MNGSAWLPAHDRTLRALYPHMRTDDIARITGRSLSALYGRANILGLDKSDAYNASRLSGRNVKGHAIHGVAQRFPKGHVPANKGLRRPGWHRGRMRETQFKKGCFPPNKDPDFYVIGALRVNSDGYIDMRMSFEKGAMGWRALHRILWEDAHGPIPKGYIVTFRDRDRLNVCLDNLEMLTLGENCKRNSIHNLPAPLKQSIQLLGALKRTIKRRTRDAEHRGSEDASVRNAGGTEGQRQPDGSGPCKGGSRRGAGDRGLGARGSRNGASDRRPRRQRILAAATAKAGSAAAGER